MRKLLIIGLLMFATSKAHSITVYDYASGGFVVASTGPYSSSLISGTTTNNASAGFLGEYTSTNISTAKSFSATGTYGDLCSVQLSSGDWDLNYGIIGITNSAIVTAFDFGISSTSGSQFANNVTGFTAFDLPVSTLTVVGSAPGAYFRASIAGLTTYYVKYRANFTAVSTPTARGYLTARRAR